MALNSLCRSCNEVNPDGLQCDECKLWQCTRCINATEMVLTNELYLALTAKGEFPWFCPTCTNDGLYTQLLQSNTYKPAELIQLKCNPDAVNAAFPIGAHSNQATTDNAAATQAQPSDQPATTQGTQQPLAPPVIQNQTTHQMNTEANAMTQMFMTMQQQQSQMLQQMMQAQQQATQAMLQSQQQLTTLIQNLNVSQSTGNSTVRNSNGANFDQSRSAAQPMSTAPNLPRIQLPEFNGDFLKWNNFWESFQINVDQQPLHDKQNLDYLHQLLKGPAFDKIKGLVLEGDKYGEAVSILKQHYGNPTFQCKAQWDAFHLLPPVRNNLSNLEKFTDEARAILTSIERQGTPKAALAVLVPELMKKLPVILVNKFNEVRLWNQHSEDEVQVSEVIDFLRQYNQVLMLSANQAKLTHDRPPQPINNFKQQQQTQRFTASANFNQQMEEQKPFRRCVFCSNEGHFSDDCKKVIKLEQRKQHLVRERRCFNCIGTGHLVSRCPRTKPCFTCKQTGHHNAICNKRNMPKHNLQLNQCAQLEQGYADTNDEASHTSMVNAQINMASDQKDNIMMAAFPCKVTNPKTMQTCELIVYVDGGAKLTCISQDAAKKLKLKTRKEVTLAVSRFNADDVDMIKAEVVRAQLNGIKGFTMDIEAFAVAKTAPAFKVGPIQLNNQAMKKIRQLQPLNRPPHREEQRPVDILIGQDYLNAIMGPQISATKVQHLMFVYHTPLGNVLCGNASPSHDHINGAIQSTCLLHSAVVSDPMERLWQLEAIGINSPDNNLQCTKNQQMIDEFNSKVEFKDGRYEVGIPWKTSDVQLATNFHVAKGRLESTLRTLAPNGKATAMFKDYNEVIQDQLANKIVEPVPTTQLDGPVKHYLAHFPVVKKDHATTKVRIVFDACTKTKRDNKSLNDMVYIGPCLLNDLAGILLRFRTYHIAIVSDIEKAFLQVGLHTIDRDAFRFLWLKDPTKPSTRDNIVILRFARVPFGLGSSPFLLGATVKYHLDQHPTSVSNVIARNLYVDNVIMGAESTSEAADNYETSKNLFNDASMNLRRMSNDLQFNSMVPTSDQSQSTTVKVLGLSWNASTDEIAINGVKDDSSSDNTKRLVAHHIGQWFDPMGLVCPLMVRSKVFNQKIWKENLGWDDQLPVKLQNEWNDLKQELAGISTIQVARRCILDRKHPVQMCCFTDSSESAFAACVYLRQEVNGQVSCQLVFAKSRVAPIKPKMTIPQLELTAVLIGARAIKFVSSQCDLQIDETRLWTDSQIVLHWLHSTKDLTPYVERRKHEILKTITNFGYVETKSNPADLGTRGCNLPQLMVSNWFQGPKWLQSGSNQWPVWPPKSINTSTMVTKVEFDVPCPPKAETCHTNSTSGQKVTTSDSPGEANNGFQMVDSELRTPLSGFSDHFRPSYGTSGQKLTTSGFSKNLKNGFPMVDSGSKMSLPVASGHFRSKSVTFGLTGNWSTCPEPLISTDPMVQSTSAMVVSPGNDDPFNCGRRSTLQSMLRVVSYCRRFINRLRKRPAETTQTINTEELKAAWWILVRQNQKTYLAEEFKLLHQKKRNQLINQLDLIIQDDIIRCGGRLGNAFPDETALPILLAKSTKFTNLVIKDAHSRVFHYGVKSTLAGKRVGFHMATLKFAKYSWIA